MRTKDDILQQIIEAYEQYQDKTPSLAGFQHIDCQDYSGLVNEINEELQQRNIKAVFTASSLGFSVDFT